MASLSGVSSSNTVSSLMNSANMISGLASGLDTEGMIESLVQSYQTKISQLNQKITKTEWKQDAYRSIIQKLVGFSNKYTSYTSSTNLMSPSFFSGAVKVQSKGDFKDSVTASGKTSSDIKLNAVHQLARAAQYRTKSNLSTGEAGSISASEDFKLFQEGQINLSNLSGSLTLKYGSKSVSISFNENTDVDAIKDIEQKLTREGKSTSAENVLTELINQKLADQKIVFTNGNSESADKRIQAVAGSNGSITFKEQGTAKNGLYISGASGNIAKQLGLNEDDLKNAEEKKLTGLQMSKELQETGEGKGLTRSLSAIEYLAEKSNFVNGGVMNMSLDGSTKQIALPHVEVKKTYDGDEYYLNGDKVTKEEFAGKYTEALQKSVSEAFKDKVEVKNNGENGELKLEFRVKNEGSSLIINTDVGDALGIGRAATSYLNTSKTLKDLVGSDGDGGLKGLEAVKDKTGNYALDDKGKKQYDFTLNGVKIGTYTEDTKLSEIMADINSNKEAGVQVAYSQTTQNFTFTAKETGAESKIELGDDLAQAMFGRPGSGAAESNFADTYGLDLEDGKKQIYFHVPGYTASSTVKSTDSIEDIAKNLNGRLKNLGYTASYNDLTGQLMVTDKTGKEVDLSITDSREEGGYEYEVDKEKFTSSYTPGQDAVFNITINDETMEMTRSSNSVDIDGLTINMQETFNSKAEGSGYAVEDAKKSVTFQSKTDSDKIVDAIKTMVEDYNTMMSEVKSAYSTMPYQKSNGTFANYEPLTDEDREGMSESAIERYEEKAKQGILFGDRNLSNLYTKMNQAFSFANKDDVDTLREMGITVGYNLTDNTQSVQIDEDKLRAMLDSDPDRVANLFTKTDGIMDRMKTQLDYYAKTTGEPKGVLIQQAGSPLSSLSLMNNQWQKEIENYNTQIEKWQDKLSDQVDRYTSQFARLEQLIQQMNSQSSTLAGMMGG